jgi:hypothetical protein
MKGSDAVSESAEATTGNAAPRDAAVRLEATASAYVNLHTSGTCGFRRARAWIAAKTNSLPMLAHELRNPLAPLRKAAEILKATIGLRDETQWRLSDFDGGFWRAGDEIEIENSAGNEAVLRNLTLPRKPAEAATGFALVLRAERVWKSLNG